MLLMKMSEFIAISILMLVHSVLSFLRFLKVRTARLNGG